MKPQLNFLFTTWEGGGNVTPALVVVRKLVAAGHRVRVMSEACNRPESEAAGAAFVAWKRAPSRADRCRESQAYHDYAAATPQEGLISVIQTLWCGASLGHAHDVIDELRREPADLVVTNDLLFGVMAGCESVNQPFVTFGPNISMTPLPGIPPMGPGFPPARNEQERQLHRDVAAGSIQMFDSGLPALNTTRAAIGLPPLEHVVDQFKAAEMELIGTSPAFDFPADSVPENVRYVGPQTGDPAWAKPWQSPWPAGDTRPMVAVSFSTTFQGHTAMLQTVVDALAKLPVRVLVTLGSSIRPDEIRAPYNCIVVDSAPHSRVFASAAVVITHGGHGTVMQGLLARAPMLVIPHGRDQNDNAVRVTHRGAGLSVMPGVGAAEIQTAVEALLSDPSYKAAAKRLGDAVAADVQNSIIVEELETVATRACVAAA